MSIERSLSKRDSLRDLVAQEDAARTRAKVHPSRLQHGLSLQVIAELFER